MKLISYSEELLMKNIVKNMRKSFREYLKQYDYGDSKEFPDPIMPKPAVKGEKVTLMINKYKKPF